MVQESVSLYGMSLDEFEALLYVDASSPSGLRWKVTSNPRALKGSVAGCYSETVKHPCWRLKINKIPMILARVLWFMYYKEVPLGVVDHKNGNTRDHSIINLRAVPHRINCQNREVKTETGVPGVYLRSDMYGNLIFRCQGVCLDGKRWSKVFAVKKYGHEQAFNLAKQYRLKMEAENNTQSRRMTLDTGRDESSA